MQLQITISTVNDTDFNDVAISYKVADVLLDGEKKNIGGSYLTGAVDADIKTEIKSKLTTLGYSWDSEI